MCYIITATDYVTRWAEAKVVKDCTADTAARFIFEHILTRFGCPNILMNDRGTKFVNETIEAFDRGISDPLLEEYPLSPTRKWCSRSFQQDSGSRAHKDL